MEFFQLIAGISLIAVFSWLIVRSHKRSSFINRLLRFDMIVGFVAGVYLVLTSIQALLIG